MSKSIASGGIGPFSPSVAIAGGTLDWALGNIFTRSISANTTFSFSNASDGRTIIFQVTNTSASPITLTWPGNVTNQDTTVPALSVKIF